MILAILLLTGRGQQLYAQHVGVWYDTEVQNLTSVVFLQASCQFIRHGTWQSVGVLRMSVRI